ncbi:hypothetical protein PIB30_042122 [Stylosanthes scabra]|uniref:Glutaredoxin domain-containing protein n=1 Tax=Stylosanthes scabra TaxID=79078 RepID=A0ABU6VF75_9FABA|nr:hypothetical protein [Stylosanthes scabra]
MGCASSKQKKRCRHCNAPYSPVSRSYSMHAHHPPQAEGDSYHVVALKSTTLDTMKLNPPAPKPSSKEKLITNSESFRFDHGTSFMSEKEKEEIKKKEEFSMELIEAKTWSNMIEQKLTKVVPKTPTRTPPGEPETINTWELMEGLEDTTPFRSPSHFKSFSFNIKGDDDDDDDDDAEAEFRAPASKTFVNDSPRSLWFRMNEEEARLNPAISEFDPEVIASFRKSLMQLSPDSPFHLKPALCDEDKQVSNKKSKGRGVGGSEDDQVSNSKDIDLVPPSSCGKEKVVLYFTSLRGVRKTYEDCCQVRMILKGMHIRMDERDVSMHSGFKEELKELLGDAYSGGGLPKVFVGRNYIGGAEEIQRLHEDGDLEKKLECCERIEEKECEVCGDVRFVPCETCSGSCKIYYEAYHEDEEEQEQEHEDCDCDDGGFQRCPDCNENGLIRCPNCCY